MFLNLLFYLFATVALVQLLYFIFIFRKLSFYKKTKQDLNNDVLSEKAISVIICAKNEAENLKRNLPYILAQKYHSFEVVLINDSSSDDTLAVMEDFDATYENVRIVNVESNETFWGNKKYALTLGIKAAAHDYLLFTDADCKPESKNWITGMAGSFTPQRTIVLGYSPYKQVKNSLVNIFIRFETMITGLQYLSYALVGIPYMGVGRNLAYHKSEFFKAKGFVDHMKLLSGDDDLFINQVATKSNTVACISSESFIVSEPKRTFAEWFRQKRRHVSTAYYYKKKHKFLLGLYYLSKLFFWITLCVLLLFSFRPFITLGIAVFLIIIKLIFYKKAFKKLNDNSLWWSAPFLEIFLITFQFAIFIANTISKPKHWK